MEPVLGEETGVSFYRLNCFALSWWIYFSFSSAMYQFSHILNVILGFIRLFFDVESLYVEMIMITSGREDFPAIGPLAGSRIICRSNFQALRYLDILHDATSTEVFLWCFRLYPSFLFRWTQLQLRFFIVFAKGGSIVTQGTTAVWRQYFGAKWDLSEYYEENPTGWGNWTLWSLECGQ